MGNDRSDYRGNPLDIIETLADVAGGLGNWIANGTPTAGSIPGEIQQRYRDHCDDWSRGPSWVQAFDPGARLFLSNACEPWLTAQGSGDPSSSPGSLIDDLSGQDLTVYGGVKLEWENQVGSPRSENVTSFTWDSGVNSLTFTRCNGSFGSANPGNTPSVTGNNACSPGGDPLPTPDPVIDPNPNPRPDPGLDPEDEPFVDPDGRPFLPMPPITDPLGDPVQLPNFPLPRVDGPSLFPADEPQVAEPGDPGTPETVAGDEEAEGEASEGDILAGIKVEVDSAPSFARQVQNVSTPTYIGAVYVYLGWEGQLDLQPEGQFLVSGQFFAAVPGMTKWRVRSAVGYTLTVTPFYASKE